VRDPFNYPCPLPSLSIWLDAEKTGRKTTNDLNDVTVEGLEAVSDRAVDVAEVRSSVNVNDIGSRADLIDGAQVFPNQSPTLS
jgi:hypothetical protein